MARGSNKMISDFTGKPATQSYASAIEAFTTSLDQMEVERKAQVSFRVKRKFL